MKLLLTPHHNAIGLKISKKKDRYKNEKYYYSTSWYDAFENKNKSGYFTEQELEIHKKNIEQIANKKTDIFEIKINELTQDIIKNFRFIQRITEYPTQEVLIDPYILGAWLGDGDSRRSTLTNVDIPVIEAWENYANCIGLDCRKYINKDFRKGEKLDNQTSYVGVYHIVNSNKKNSFKECLKKYNLIKNKHIPEEYLINNKNIRLKLLAGLIDTDGSISNNQYEITQKIESLSKNIVTLCESLGYYTTIQEVEKSCTYKGEKKIGIYYRIIFSLNQFTEELPVLIERKKWIYTPEKNIHNQSIDINGNIVIKEKHIWNEDMKIKLYSIVEKLKEIQPHTNINWNIIKENYNIFKDISNSALQTMYSKTLLLDKQKYDNLKININITEYNLIDSKWRETYERIKSILDNNICIINKTSNYYWLNNNKNNTSLQISLKKELIKKNTYILKKKEISDIKELYQKQGFIEKPPKTNSENRQEKTSNLLGVAFSNKKTPWKAQISINNRTKYLGAFSTEIEAHKTYMRHYIEYLENNLTLFL